MLARFGGEEFTVLCRGSDLKGARIVAERLRRSVEERKFTFGGKDIPVTISLGIVADPGERHQRPQRLPGRRRQGPLRGQAQRPQPGLRPRQRADTPSRATRVGRRDALLRRRTAAPALARPAPIWPAEAGRAASSAGGDQADGAGQVGRARDRWPRRARRPRAGPSGAGQRRRRDCSVPSVQPLRALRRRAARDEGGQRRLRQRRCRAAMSPADCRAPRCRRAPKSVDSPSSAKAGRLDRRRPPGSGGPRRSGGASRRIRPPCTIGADDADDAEHAPGRGVRHAEAVGGEEAERLLHAGEPEHQQEVDGDGGADAGDARPRRAAPRGRAATARRQRAGRGASGGSDSGSVRSASSRLITDSPAATNGGERPSRPSDREARQLAADERARG